MPNGVLAELTQTNRRKEVKWFSSSRAAALALLLFTIIAGFRTVGEQLARFPLLGDLGYPDSYIQYDVQHFQQTGIIYRDLSQPPYLPALYSPFVYISLALPGLALPSLNPFLGPRLTVFAAYILCLALTISITRKLIGVRGAFAWALLLAISIGCMRGWVLQFRGDFQGIVFSLLSIRLLLTRRGWPILFAGLCAGLAVQFKITMIAAVAAGVLWLLTERRWRDLAAFTIASALASVGLYFLFSVREPRMLAQLTTLRSIVPDYRGLMLYVGEVIREPVFLLAVGALTVVARQPWRPLHRWRPLLFFAAISFCIALATDLQAGGNVNYFYEFLFAVTPLAVLSTLHLLTHAGKARAGMAVLAALITFNYVLPNAVAAVSLRSRLGSEAIRTANQEFTALRDTLQGKHIFSTVPYIAIFDPQPALMEPGLLSYMASLGRFDPTPLINQLDRQEFEAVITDNQRGSYRGIEHIRADLRGAIATSYAPYCELRDLVVHFPRGASAETGLKKNLQVLGCDPNSCRRPGSCSAW